MDRIRAAVAEVVSSNPDVVHASITSIVQELQRQKPSVPVVFVGITDPVETGIVKSWPRPGGNATGFMSVETALTAKRLELLKEIAPGVSRVLVLVNSGIDANLIALRAIEAAAPFFGVQVSSGIVRDGSAIEGIARTLFALASRYRLPAIYSFRYFGVDGGLLSYGPDIVDMYRRSVTYVDRILKGEKPGDLPVQAPVKYELVINLNAAKAIGLPIPPTLIARADEIVE